MPIAVDGAALAKSRGTGLSTHARLLAQALLDLGAEVEILYGAPHPGPGDMPAQISIADVPAPASRSRYQRLRSLVPTLEPPRTARWPAAATRVSLGDAINMADSGLLDTGGSALYLRNGFARAWAHFIAYRRLLPVRLPPDVPVVHWSQPLPLYATNAVNIYSVLDLIPLRMPYATTDHVGLHWSLVRENLRHADLVVTPSEATRRDLLDLYNPKRTPIVTLPLGVPAPAPLPPNTWQPILRKAYGLEPDQYFLAVGELQPRKNYERLLDAFLTSTVTMPLVIVGPEGWRAERELEVLAQLAATRGQHAPEGTAADDRRYPSPVRYLGYVSPAHLDALFRGARALLFPSLAEGFGLPIVEAFARGTPVLTSVGGATEEIAAQAAVLVDPRSTPSLRTAIETLARDTTLCDHLVDAGRRRFADFSTDAFARRLRDTYTATGLVRFLSKTT